MHQTTESDLNAATMDDFIFGLNLSVKL